LPAEAFPCSSQATNRCRYRPFRSSPQTPVRRPGPGRRRRRGTKIAMTAPTTRSPAESRIGQPRPGDRRGKALQSGLSGSRAGTVFSTVPGVAEPDAAGPSPAAGRAPRPRTSGRWCAACCSAGTSSATRRPRSSSRPPGQGLRVPPSAAGRRPDDGSCPGWGDETRRLSALSEQPAQ
jgi:hypothetical protein